MIGYEDMAPSDVEARQALATFLQLGAEARHAVAQQLLKRFRTITAEIGEDELGFEINSEDDVWNHIQPNEIVIRRRSLSNHRILVQVLAECDWDPEHGLQIVFESGNRLACVSGQGDSFDDPPDETPNVPPDKAH